MKRLLSLFLALALTLTYAPMASAGSDEAMDAANALYGLGLFGGTGTDADGNPVFELDRAPTRYEAVTMLVRLLGKTNEAENGIWDVPFTDLADWARPYVGYAYANQLAAGTSATIFSGDDPITASQYLTLVLRSLGYESGVDFQWDSAWVLSDQLGITSGEYPNASAFTRGDVAVISYHALSAKPKNTENNFTEISSVTPVAYQKDGKYYDGASIHWPLKTFQCNGSPEVFMQSGDVYTLLVAATNSFIIEPSSNPYFSGRINLYQINQDYTENDKAVWVFDGFEYLHWTEYTGPASSAGYVEYRRQGNSCTFCQTPDRADGQLFEQDGIRCTGYHTQTYVCVQDVLDRLGIAGKFVLTDVLEWGPVWSIN